MPRKKPAANLPPTLLNKQWVMSKKGMVAQVNTITKGHLTDSALTRAKQLGNKMIDSIGVFEETLYSLTYPEQIIGGITYPATTKAGQFTRDELERNGVILIHV